MQYAIRRSGYTSKDDTVKPLEHLRDNLIARYLWRIDNRTTIEIARTGINIRYIVSKNTRKLEKNFFDAQTLMNERAVCRRKPKKEAKGA